MRTQFEKNATILVSKSKWQMVNGKQKIRSRFTDYRLPKQKGMA